MGYSSGSSLAYVRKMVADAAAGLAKFRDNRTTINQYLVHLKMLEMCLLLISAFLLPEAEWLLYIFTRLVSRRHQTFYLHGPSMKVSNQFFHKKSTSIFSPQFFCALIIPPKIQSQRFALLSSFLSICSISFCVNYSNENNVVYVKQIKPKKN